MTTLQAIFLGALQGLTEFLPVSSSGHLVLSRELLDIESVPILFDILLHVATLCAVFLVFRRRILAIITSLIRLRDASPENTENRRLFLLICLATVITGILGVAFSFLEIETQPRIVSMLFIVTGAILFPTKFTRGEVDYSTIKTKHALITGIIQGFGVLPGISRSGITISGALFSGMKRENAGEFSFLLAIPAILGALVIKIGQADDLIQVITPLALAAGLAVAFAVGLISLVLLLRIVKRGKLYFFSFYLIPLGIVTFILL